MTGKIGTWVPQMVKQVAAMDGDVAILGDSNAERSIMTRMLQHASPTEKDFIQKFLDGERITEPLNRNKNRVVVRDFQNGSENSSLKTNKELPESAYRDITVYDNDGRWIASKVYNKNNKVIERSSTIYNKDGSRVVTDDDLIWHRTCKYDKNDNMYKIDGYYKSTGKEFHYGRINIAISNFIDKYLNR